VAGWGGVVLSMAVGAIVNWRLITERGVRVSGDDYFQGHVEILHIAAAELPIYTCSNRRLDSRRMFNIKLTSSLGWGMVGESSNSRHSRMIS
jgi:hypothetical protein